MKAFLILVFCLFASMVVQAQDLQDLILEYEAWCNETVLDTISQVGYISYETLQKKDTIWRKPPCRKYKRIHDNWITVEDIQGTLIIDGEASGWGFRDGKEKKEELVERPYICECKRAMVRPFSGHFWFWVKNR